MLLEPEMGGAKIWFKKEGAGRGDGYEKCFVAGSNAGGGEESYLGSDRMHGRDVMGGQSIFGQRLRKRMAPMFA